MMFSIDVETACTVEGCIDHGKSICREGHSLSPWHSRITVAAVAGEDNTRRVIRGATSKDIVQELELQVIGNDPNWTICGQGFKFDWLHLARHGFVIPLERWVADSNLAAFVLTDKIPDHWLLEYEAKRLRLGKATHRRAGKHGLKTLAPYFLGVEPFWEPDDGNLDDDVYVMKDAEYSLALIVELEKRLKEKGEYEFYKNKLLPWTKMLLESEWRGITIDMEALAAKEKELATRSFQLLVKLDEIWRPAHQAYFAKLREELSIKYDRMAEKAGKPIHFGSRYWKLYELAREKLPRRVDYDSPKQMAWLLKEHLGYNIQSLEGDESTAREVLERLADEGKEDVKTYLEWRKTNKILTAFLPTYRLLAVQEDGGRYVIHPCYNPTNTRTGRTSSERPNMQQVPPQLRALFVARPGYKFIGYDAAAIEAKLIALYSEDPTLYALIAEGISLHDHNTKVFFGLDCTYIEVKKDHADKRAASKNVGFALFYNAGANRIRIAFAQKGYHLTTDECRRLHERFKKSYQVAMAYSKDVVKFMEDGNVMPNLLGRPLRIEHKEDAYMQAFNTLIQSSASDLNLHGAYLASEEFKRASLDTKPLLFVHDFVAFEVLEQDVERADEILVRNLTAFDLETRNGPIKLEVEGGTMSRWEK